MLHAFRKIVQLNDADVQPLVDPDFAAWRDDPRFAPIIAALRDRANDERAKLGMPPYQPLLD